ncbi:MAG TPA: tyrosine-type recombinase/integrase [Candidatus Krumholzibacteria bacterium]|nr:tyrosine-type recombinase/integrase [Candidatus Krumholzibacteria bacterium]
MPETMPLSVDIIKALPPAPAGKRTRLHDSQVSGLFVEVTDRGTKTFKFRKRMGRRVQMLTLGRFPELKVKEAKRLALAFAGEMVTGTNPQERKQQARDELTLGEFLRLYLDRHARPHKKTWRQDEQQFHRYLSGWASHQLSSISPADVQRAHVAVRDGAGPYAANRMLALVHTLFAKAEAWGFFAGPNPARNVKRFRERSRERFLQADELPRFLQALHEEPNTTQRDFFLLCLFTGARRGNVQTMRWDQLNLEAGTWRIPDTKSGDSHTVPLVTSALAVLRSRLPDARKSPWVFPGPGRTGHLVESRAAWVRILKRAGIEDLRIHDLRRTMGSWQAATGASLPIIGKTLAHKTPTTTMIYSRLDIDPVREAMEKATAAILGTSREDA